MYRNISKVFNLSVMVILDQNKQVRSMIFLYKYKQGRYMVILNYYKKVQIYGHLILHVLQVSLIHDRFYIQLQLSQNYGQLIQFETSKIYGHFILFHPRQIYIVMLHNYKRVRSIVILYYFSQVIYLFINLTLGNTAHQFTTIHTIHYNTNRLLGV